MLVLPCCVCKSLLCALLAPLSGIMRARIYARFLLGKVDMPYFELVLTTRCTLRCESCNNLMQYFDSKTAYTCTLSGIQSTLEALLERVDSIYWVRIIGGEPLLFKDIDTVVEILDSSSKVKSFDIVTNATIIPKPRLLEALQASSKCFVSISDYTKSPNLSVKLHIQKLQDLLSARKIPHSVLWQEATAAWFSPGQIYKRGRDRQGIEANFRSCLMPCVSVMSHEGIPKLIGGGGESVKDSAFWLEAAISSPSSRDRPEVLSSLRGLKNAVSSSKILESQNNTEITNNREQLELESTFSKVDSRVNVDCHDFDKSKSRNDNKNAISEKMDSKDNSPSLSSRDDESPLLSSRASEASVAIHNTNLESSFEKVDSSVDCHAAAHAVSRNDSKNADSSTAKSVGEIFICPIASSLSRLKGLEEFRGDFVSLDHACDKYTILAFYAQEFFKACDYCHDMAAPKTPIPIAVQTKATLELTR